MPKFDRGKTKAKVEKVRKAMRRVGSIAILSAYLKKNSVPKELVFEKMGVRWIVESFQNKTHHYALKEKWLRTQTRLRCDKGAVRVHQLKILSSIDVGTIVNTQKNTK